MILDAIEADPTQAEIIVEVQRLMGLIGEQEVQIQKSTTKESGLTRADDLEFRERLCHARSGRYENCRAIARLIGWSYRSNAAGSF